MYATQPLSAALSTAEQRDFELIVRSARDAGWLDDACSINAVPLECRVLITCVAGDQVRTQAYDWNSRWPYQFLHDLAHGQWRSKRAVTEFTREYEASW